MTHSVSVTSLAPQTFKAGEAVFFNEPEVLTTVNFDEVTDSVITDRFNRPMVVRTIEGSSSARLIRQSSARVGLTPEVVGRQVVETIVGLGHDVQVRNPVTTRGGWRQAIVVPTLHRVDPTNWDHGLFARDPDAEEGDGMNLVIGLFFRKLRPQLRAGWFRLYCSNQLLDERMGLTLPLTRISATEDVDTWATTALGTGTMLSKVNAKRKKSTDPADQPLPAPALSWAADRFTAEAGNLNEIGFLRSEIESDLGMTAGDVLARELFAMREAAEIHVPDLVNAVTNLARPRWSWIDQSYTMPGDPDRPIVSPSTVLRHEQGTVDRLMQALFLGTRATGCDPHPVVENYPFKAN